jgi:multiple sugar transport system substrate-binding protein
MRRAMSHIAARLLLLALALASCGGTPAAVVPTNAPEQAGPTTGADVAPTSAPATGGENVTLSLWIFEGEEGFLSRLKEAFEAQNPTITLEITEIPEDQYVTKIDTALAANEPPDIGFVYGGQQRWLKSGKFLPLDELFKEKNIKPENYNQNAMSLYCAYEGKNYCIGSYTGAVLLFYNKDMFDAAGIAYPSASEPMTVEEYVDLAKRLNKPNDDIAKRVWGGSAGNTWWYMDWTTHFSEDGRKAVGFTNDALTARTYELIAQLEKDGVAPSASDMQLLGDIDLLSQGKQATAITDNFVAIAGMEQAGIRYGAAPPPVEQKGDKPFIITWSDAFGVFSQSKHPREAELFLAFLATEGNRLRVEADTMPLDMTIAEDWATKNEGRREALTAIRLARPVIFVPNIYAFAGGPLGDAYSQILEGTKSSQEAMDEAADLLQSDLDKAWETWEQIK